MKRKPKGYWTIFENCFNDAQKYNTRVEWQLNSSKAYATALKNGWSKKCTAHMKYTVLPSDFYSFEMCFEEALKYKNKRDFKKNNSKVYSIAVSRGWLKDICTHMERLGNSYLRALYVYEHPDNSVYVGLTYNYQERYNSHMIKNKILIKKKALGGQVYKELGIFYPKEEAAIKEDELIEEYRANGWTILNKRKGGALGYNGRIVTKDKCIESAQKCKNRAEWIERFPGAHQAARRHGWFDECVIHMDLLMRHNYWTKDLCTESSSKFDTRSDWRKNDNAAYIAACKYGWLPECTAHMTPINGVKKKIQCIETNEIFESIAEAGRKMKIDKNGISSMLKGRTKISKGFTFKYL